MKDFDRPTELSDALLVGGPRPAIIAVHPSLPSDLGVELHPGEIPAHSFVSFAMDIGNVDAVSVNSVDLSCGEKAPVQIKVHPEPHAPLFLSFDPSTAGVAGCALMAVVETRTTATRCP